MKQSSNKNKSYEAPRLTVVTFKVEQGFFGSENSSPFVHLFNDEEVGTTFGRTGYGQESESSNQQSWF